MASKEQRSTQKRQAWRQTVRRWRASGESVRAFCRREGISELSFYWGVGNFRGSARSRRQRPQGGGHVHALRPSPVASNRRLGRRHRVLPSCI